MNDRRARLLRLLNGDGRGGTSSLLASGRKTASAVGLPGGAVHDGFGDDRLRHSARAIGDHQRGRLDWKISLGHEAQLMGPNDGTCDSSRRVWMMQWLTLVTV